MKSDKKQSDNKRSEKNRPWKKPEITTLSISRDTRQLLPPDTS